MRLNHPHVAGIFVHIWNCVIFLYLTAGSPPFMPQSPVSLPSAILLCIRAIPLFSIIHFRSLHISPFPRSQHPSECSFVLPRREKPNPIPDSIWNLFHMTALVLPSLANPAWILPPSKCAHSALQVMELSPETPGSARWCLQKICSGSSPHCSPWKPTIKTTLPTLKI